MSALALALALPVVVALGTAGAVSSALNGFIGRMIGPLRGTYTFLAVGAAISGGLALALGESANWTGALAWYLYLPGAVNLLFIFTMVSIINYIGAMLTVSCIFIGQVLISTYLDAIGFLGLPIVAASTTRLTALAILVASLLLLILSRQSGSVALQANQGPTTLGRALATGLALVLGMSIGTATAINAVLGQEIGPLSSTFMFLTPGAIILAIWFHLIRRRPLPNRFRPIFLLPGTLNVLQVSGGIFLIPIIGLQIFMTASFTANMLTGMVIDRFGWFAMPVSPLTRQRVTAAALLVLGVILSLIPA